MHNASSGKMQKCLAISGPDMVVGLLIRFFLLYSTLLVCKAFVLQKGPKRGDPFSGLENWNIICSTWIEQRTWVLVGWLVRCRGRAAAESAEFGLERVIHTAEMAPCLLNHVHRLIVR